MNRRLGETQSRTGLQKRRKIFMPLSRFKPRTFQLVAWLSYRITSWRFDTINFCPTEAAIAQSVQRLTTGWTNRGSNPGGGEIFLQSSRPSLKPTQPPTQFGTGSFPGVKRPGRDADHPHSSSAEVKERVDVYLQSTYRLRGLFQGELTDYLMFF